MGDTTYHQMTLVLSNAITHALTCKRLLKDLYNSDLREWTWDVLYADIADVARECINRLRYHYAGDDFDTLDTRLADYPGIWVYELSDHVVHEWLRETAAGSTPLLTDAAYARIVVAAITAFMDQEVPAWLSATTTPFPEHIRTVLGL